MLRALQLEPADATPVWFMRQAGRSLPEYRLIRERFSLLEICRRPDVCAAVTLQPVRRLGVDAAILFADIMLPLIAAGVELDIVEGVGPVIERPIRTAADIETIRPLCPDDAAFVAENIAATLAALPSTVPLIGFAGAPFTLASYLVEGKPSRDFLESKRLMYAEPEIWHELMRRLAVIVAVYLQVQIDAGVHAVQIFDSWVGALSVDDYVRYVQPATRDIFAALVPSGVPAIHFGTGTAALLAAMTDAGGDAIGVDWRVPLDGAWRRIGYDHAIQGNLDPLVLLGPWDVVRRETDAILERAGGRPGHIFNLGHGVHPQTSVDALERLVAYVHERTAR